jgi:hypothetical protein
MMIGCARLARKIVEESRERQSPMNLRPANCKKLEILPKLLALCSSNTYVQKEDDVFTGEAAPMNEIQFQFTAACAR